MNDINMSYDQYLENLERFYQKGIKDANANLNFIKSFFFLIGVICGLVIAIISNTITK